MFFASGENPSFFLLAEKWVMSTKKTWILKTWRKTWY
jgi:hypothetical protein